MEGEEKLVEVYRGVGDTVLEGVLFELKFFLFDFADVAEYELGRFGVLF